MLTDLKINKMKSEGQTKKYSDRDGLELHHRKSGNKIFIFRFQWDRKPQSISLGRYPSLSLTEARQIAASYRAMLDKGIDPRESLKTSNAKTITLGNIADRWLEKNKRNWREPTVRLHQRSLSRDILPLLGDMPLDDITKTDLLRVIHPHEELGHHEIAHRLHDRLKAIFDYALAAGLTENYPFIGLKKALTPKPKIKNQLAVKPDEAHKMLTRIKQGKASIITKLYVELLANLFVRPSELRLAKWSEFSMQHAEWNIPTDRMKMDAPHWVPLTPEVVMLIKELRLITGFTPYLFCSPSTKKQQPISETCARKLLHNAGYKNHHTLHGFRVLASTVLHSESHFRTDAIEAQLAHKVQGVRGVYMRAEFKGERRKLMEWYSQWISKISIEQDLQINNR